MLDTHIHNGLSDAFVALYIFSIALNFLQKAIQTTSAPHNRPETPVTTMPHNNSARTGGARSVLQSEQARAKSKNPSCPELFTQTPHIVSVMIPHSPAALCLPSPARPISCMDTIRKEAPWDRHVINILSCNWLISLRTIGRQSFESSFS